MIKYIYPKLFTSIIAIGLIFGMPRIAEAQEITSSDTSIYAYLHPELNFIQFYKRSSLDKIATKWATPNPYSISIVHLGDSHVQSDIFPGELRKNLQAVKGNGGRGMVFPYAIAKTYSGNDYKSSYSGNWKCARSIEYIPRLPLGASGITCQTFDSNASFTIQFKAPLSEKNKTLKIFCKKSYSSYDFIVKTREKEVLVVVDNYVCPDLPYVEIDLPVIGDTITIQLTKQNPHESEFELYGMSLEAGQKEGLMLHCLGIGGAQYRSILAQTLFQDQLPFLNPDLVIVDFGTNDYLYTDEIPEKMESEIKNVIRKVRFSAPNADILLTTPQDMNRKGRNIESGEDFSDLIRKIAKEENCAFYDWFWISGGPRTMITWQEKGLSNDLIHLTQNGYKLKGNLLTDAFLNTIALLKSSPKMDSLIFPLDSLKKIAEAGDTIQPKIPKPVYNAKGYRTVTHIIKAGETLGGIAQRYHTTVSAIMAQNGLRNTTIRAGKVLKIKVKKR
jgi:lysophospholipase L1-like esterase